MQAVEKEEVNRYRSFLHDGLRSLGLRRVCLSLLWFAVLLYIGAFLFYTFNLYDCFSFRTYDLSIFDQATWLISRGRTPFVTVRGLHILADHFSPVLYLLAPLYWIWDSPKTLLTVQTLALASGAFPVYFLAHRRLGAHPLALLFAVTYLSYPAVAWVNVHEFHPESLAVSCLLGAFWFLNEKRFVMYFALLVLAALTKESIGFTLIALGIYALFINCQVGTATVALGFGAVILSSTTIRYYNHGDSSYLMLYERYGHSPSTILGYLLGHPLATLRDLNTPVNVRYLLNLLHPVCFLALLAPDVLAIALPALLLNLLSSRLVMHDIYHQYTVLIIPFVIVASIIGLSRWQQWSRRSTSLLAFYLSICVTVNFWQKSPLLNVSQEQASVLSVAQVRALQTILAAIPAQASISAQSPLVTHLCHRPTVYMAPNPHLSLFSGYGKLALRQLEGTSFVYSSDELNYALTRSEIEYIVLCPPASTFPLTPFIYADYAITVMQCREYGIVAISESAVLLRHHARFEDGLHLLERYAGMSVRNAHDVEVAYWRWTTGAAVR